MELAILSIFKSRKELEFYKKQNQELKLKIDELECQISELSEKSKQYKKQSYDLIANVSHEIRTPISAIMMVLENLTNSITPWSATIGKQLLAYTDKLTDLTTYFLDCSRIDSGKVKLDFQTTELCKMIEDAIGPLLMVEAQKNISFQINVHPKHLSANLDSRIFAQAINNLVANAIKFSPQDGQIYIDVFDNEGFIYINVIDEGPGVAQEDIDKLFERFHSKSNGFVSQISGGTGIGLSIARWVVELHKGEINVLQDENAKGAVFQIVIPQDL